MELVLSAGLTPCRSHFEGDDPIFQEIDVRSRLTASFDHGIGDGKQCRWNVDTDRLCGLEVHYQVQPRGLLDGEITRLLALYDAINVAG